MAKSSALNNDQELSAADYADLQHIGSQLPEGHPIKAKIDRTLSMSQPNAGLAGPAGPGPVEKVAPTAGPVGRYLTAAANREADVAQAIPRQLKEGLTTKKGLMDLGARAVLPLSGGLPDIPGNVKGLYQSVVNPEASERFGKGDIAGGLGEVSANVGNMEALRQASGGSPIRPTVEGVTAPIRGAVKGINAVTGSDVGARALGATGGGVLFRSMGLPAWEGAVLGGWAGRQLIPKLNLPGERFGLPEPTPLPPSEGGTVSRGVTIGASPSGRVAEPERIYENPVSTRAEINNPPRVSVAQGGTISKGGTIGAAPRGAVPTPEQFIGSPTSTRPEAIPSTILRTSTIAQPTAEAAPKVSMADQIATAKGLGFKNLHEAISKFGFEGWQKILGQGTTPAVAEPPSVRPGNPTPFGNAPLTPTDLAKVRNTTPPTWADIERQYRKEQFYDQAPMTKTKAQLVNEANQVEPSIVAKSEANTSPYNRNLPTKKRK